MAACCCSCKVQLRAAAELGMASPPHTLYPGASNSHSSSYTLLWAMMQRGPGHEWASRQITEIIGNLSQFPWGWKYKLDIHELSQGLVHPAPYSQREKAKQSWSKNVRKKDLSTIHQTANCALLCAWDVALWGQLSSSMNRIRVVVSTIGQSVWNHSLHSRTCAHNCPKLLSCFIEYIYKPIKKLQSKKFEFRCIIRQDILHSRHIWWAGSPEAWNGRIKFPPGR